MSTQDFYVCARGLHHTAPPHPPPSSSSYPQADFTLPKQMSNDIRGSVAAARVRKEAATPEGPNPFALNVDWEMAFFHWAPYISVTVYVSSADFRNKYSPTRKLQEHWGNTTCWVL